MACETADSSPTPIVPAPPPPPVPVDAAPVAVDAAPIVANLGCYYNGPKELITLKTDLATMTGRLFRMTPGPVPDREIFYRVQADGPGSFALIFDRYDKGDYVRMYNAKPPFPRENMVPGKSVIARVFLRGTKSYIVGVGVDLATGMVRKFPDNEYPCEPYW